MNNDFKEKCNLILIIYPAFVSFIVIIFLVFGFEELDQMFGKLFILIYSLFLIFYGFYFGVIKRDISLFFKTSSLLKVKTYRYNMIISRFINLIVPIDPIKFKC